MVEAVGLYKDTNEDIVFPSYLEDLFSQADANVSALSDYAADISSGIAKAEGAEKAVVLHTNADSANPADNPSSEEVAV